MDWRGRILSNLANTPFQIGSFTFPSVESTLQGIKFSDPLAREKVFRLSGIEALKAGRVITQSVGKGRDLFVYWQDETIPFNSLGHRMLLAMFIHEKVRQNVRVQQALLETKGTFIFHDMGERENTNTSLPEKFYIEVLLAQRRLLQKLNKIYSAE